MLQARLRSLTPRRPAHHSHGHSAPPVRHRSRAARPTLPAACAPEGSVSRWSGGGEAVVEVSNASARWWWGGPWVGTRGHGAMRGQARLALSQVQQHGARPEQQLARRAERTRRRVRGLCVCTARVARTRCHHRRRRTTTGRRRTRRRTTTRRRVATTTRAARVQLGGARQR